jgi:hypothetical protein
MTRRSAISLLVSAALLFAAARASADEPGPDRGAETSEQKSYALPLALSYAAPPALMLAAAGAFSNAEEGLAGGMTAAGAFVGLAAPISVHAAYGEGRRAWRTPFAALGSVVVFGLAGALIGATQCREPDPNLDDQESCYDGYVGLGIGMAVGYVGWAVLDVAAWSRTRRMPAPGPTATVSARMIPKGAGLALSGSF